MERDLRNASDASLVVAIGRYHQEALAEAYRRHGAAAYGLAKRLLRHAQLAEDVVQELFLRLWDKPERFDPERGSLRSFLLTDAHGRALDLVRAEDARRRREEREAQIAVPTGAYDLEAEVWALVSSETVRESLSRLSEDERRSIELAYFGGQTYQEVAATLGQPEGTVKSRIRSGLKKLRAELVSAGMVDR
ncbi:MAG: sigma-70 family RNA polymerase sigma factor [Acidimicrobiia bacterium]|nr:sigma-70 family RNA polymerase sigma factor [Acidimicrobiia bacterium]